MQVYLKLKLRGRKFLKN